MQAMTRYVGVAIAICSWIAVSNHCAFAAVAPDTDKTQMECPFHSKPAKQKQESPQVQCCKVLRAVVLAKDKTWTRNDACVVPAIFPAQTTSIVTFSLRTSVPLLLDTGPPRALSFSELILQRSLLAHAPPLIA